MKTVPGASRARALAIIALLTVPLLAGCAEADPGVIAYLPDGCVAPGSASDGVEVTGEFGDNLELQRSGGPQSSALQRTVLQAGGGEAIAEGATFVGQLNIFVGDTGEPYSQERTRSVFDRTQLAPWYFDTIRCATAGDRIASTLPASELLGPGVGGDLGIADDAKMVVVVDLRAVLSSEAGRAAGTPGELPAGFPQIALDPAGAPSVTIPGELASATEFAVAPSIVGAGEPVAADQAVLVQYQAYVVRTGEAFEQTWGGAPVSLPLDEVNQGLRNGIVGQPVGSQVVIIVPPGAGYSAQELEQLGYQADDVIVYVVDILDAG